MFPFQFKNKAQSIVKKDTFSLWFKVAVACVPSAIMGILFDDYLDAYLQTPIVISIMLIFYGLLFILIENWNKKRTPTTMALSDISYKTAILIGAFQVLSLIPGTSRSGATIIGALLIGVSRVAAAEFTFFLAVPTMLGASAFKLLKFGFEFTSAELLMQTENKKGFQVKDLIVTALLSLCALVIYIICAFLSFSPYTMLVVSPLWSLLAAITYFLVAAKTKKPWALFIFCAVTGIYGFYPPMIICCIIAGIISALIAWKTGCTNGKTLTFSYIIYMVLAAFSGTYIPFLFFSNQTLEQYAGMFGESYLGILQTLVSPVTAIIMLVVVAICAFVGALIAKKLLKKHFKKAGMV